MGTQPVQGELFPSPRPSDVIAINERCLLRKSGRHRVVVVCGLPVAQFATDDPVAQAYAMVNLVDQGWADQNDVARAFCCSARTLRRHQSRFAEGGLIALGRPAGYPEGRSRLPRWRKRRILHLKEQGHSNRSIECQLGIDEKSVRKLLRRWGWKPAAVIAPPGLFDQAAVSTGAGAAGAGADPKLSAFSFDQEPLPFTIDCDPLHRIGDRLLARLGLLDDAAPLFCSGHVPHAGVLLAVPSLVRSGVFQIAREVYGPIAPAFYGLRTSIGALLLLALLRIKRPEALKEHPPGELGRILGLDRAPEVKTLRRKLARLAQLGRAVEFGRALAQRRVQARGAAMGVLYIDGHVRVYHGRHRLPKAHVTQMRISLPATTDYWVNDRSGDPLFVVTAEANAGLARMLPELLREVRAAVGSRRVTIVFDRGGWSPKLFLQIIDAGFDLLTYRKGRSPRVSRRRFQRHRSRLDGHRVEYLLADQEVRLLKGKLRLRQVTRLSEDGSHQTPILTSRRDWRVIVVACRMFGRWRQENFFKYLCEEYALDALVDYRVEPDDPHRDVPNPAWAKLDAKGRRLIAEAGDRAAAYGLKAMVNPEISRPTMRGFKIAHSAAGRKIHEILRAYVKVRARRDATSRRVAVSRTTEEPIVKLDVERKHLTNVLKMVAYQSESDLVKLVSGHYRRVEQEGRTLIQSALASAAELKVTKEALHVVLDPMSSAHRTRAIAALCAVLNRDPVVFPGTRLRLVFSVANPPD